tara:strand:+ start:1381 stop:1710 length:330 start_codon:yes stop_codon:yes gene_type:complete
MTTNQLDIDKYEGHTPAPWVVKKGERMRVWHQKNEMTSTLICSMQATHCEPQDADAQLIADAPLLLAEVKRLVRALRNADDVIKYALEMTSDDDATRVFEDYLEVNKND